MTDVTTPCDPPDAKARAEAEARQAVLTKPAGSLGRLETVACDFAAWQGTALPTLDAVTIRIFAADHGVAATGVSAYPQAVTQQMVFNFEAGGAAISVLADEIGADFGVVNLGTVEPTGDMTHWLAAGTADFTREPAMTHDQLAGALTSGATQASGQLFIGGEMGIGNTTSASAIIAALVELDPAAAVGPGTGVDGEALRHKISVVSAGLERHPAREPLDVLRCLGGFEIAALTGAYIAAAQRGIPSLVDGFICTAAALVACRINPTVRPWLMFGHRSAEPGHAAVLADLAAEPLLDLGLRLGEGSGAALAVSLLRSALALHSGMATFEQAAVDAG